MNSDSRDIIHATSIIGMYMNMIICTNDGENCPLTAGSSVVGVGVSGEQKLVQVLKLVNP